MLFSLHQLKSIVDEALSKGILGQKDFPISVLKMPGKLHLCVCLPTFYNVQQFELSLALSSDWSACHKDVLYQYEYLPLSQRH